MTADGPKSVDMDRQSARRRRLLVGGDRATAMLAAGQHGVVSLDQLRGLGIGKEAARLRCAAGRMHRVHAGVYAVGHPVLTQKGRWMAAVLACWPEAVLSHRSAAALWGLRSASGAAIDVTAARRRGRSPAGIAAHRDSHLAPRDRTVVDGIPCTTAARTLLDLAGVAGGDELRNAIVQAEIHRVFDLVSLREVIARGRGRRGVARLRLAIDEHDPTTERANPGLERAFLALCRRTGLPPPRVNIPIDLPDGQIVADFVWRSSLLIVETDDRKSHHTISAFEADKRRDQRLAVAGWTVIRCTWRQVTREGEELARRLRALLA
jgi:very-short-patch-repair endonuclease/predicted transcriptional regulator of viral defense system